MPRLLHLLNKSGFTCSLEGSGSKRDSSSSDTDSFWTTEDNIDNMASRQNGAEENSRKSTSGTENKAVSERKTPISGKSSTRDRHEKENPADNIAGPSNGKQYSAGESNGLEPPLHNSLQDAVCQMKISWKKINAKPAALIGDGAASSFTDTTTSGKCTNIHCSSCYDRGCFDLTILHPNPLENHPTVSKLPIGAERFTVWYQALKPFDWVVVVCVGGGGGARSLNQTQPIITIQTYTIKVRKLFL